METYSLTFLLHDVKYAVHLSDGENMPEQVGWEVDVDDDRLHLPRLISIDDHWFAILDVIKKRRRDLVRRLVVTRGLPQLYGRRIQEIGDVLCKIFDR